MGVKIAISLGHKLMNIYIDLKKLIRFSDGSNTEIFM